MFTDLNNLLGIDAASPTLEECVCVTESDIDGSFVLHHYMSLCLKSNGRVCLVGLAQAFNHYSNIATKLTNNLNKFKEEGRFVFVEGLKTIGGQIVDCEDGTVSDKLINFGENGNELKQLFRSIETSLSGFEKQENKPILLVVDDASLLISLGIPALQVAYFMSYLRSLLRPLGGTLLVLCQKPVESLVGEDEEMDLLWKQICYHSQLVFHVEGLSSGYCKDVHGEMTIINRDFVSKQSQIHRKIVQFKISDRNVSFFAPGMSVAVLGQ